MRRRDFFKFSAAGLGGMLAGRGLAQFGYEDRKPLKYDFFFGQLVYGKGLQWNPRPSVARSLAAILNRRTSIPASPERAEVKLIGSDLSLYPFLYWSGESEFEPLADQEIMKLRSWFEAGGFLLVDDAMGMPESGFDRSFRRDLKRIFPGEGLKEIPKDHTIFQSYYLLDQVVGRKASVPYLSGIDQGDLTVVVYSQNDLAGAIEQGTGSTYRYSVEPGGDRQRENCIRLWVNLALYATTANYKKDLIHTPFISERRKHRPR